MPLATNPNAKFELSLTSDADRPEAERPVFIYHYLTGLQQMGLADLLDRLEQSSSGSEAIKRIFEAAATGLVDWKNIRDRDGNPIPFDPQRLPEVMSMQEAMELAQQLYAGQYPTLEDKKKSESASLSSMGNSANNAEE